MYVYQFLMPYCCKKSGKSLKKGGKRNRVGNFVCSEMCETRVLMISCAVKCAAKVLIFVYDCSHLTHRQQQNLPTGSSLMKRPKKRGNKLKITGDSENKYVFRLYKSLAHCFGRSVSHASSKQYACPEKVVPVHE